jgi:uncharacterized protein YndB with AHSA1/START domain
MTSAKSASSSGEKPGHLETLHFEITIYAPARKVFDIMLDEKAYRAWTAVFSPGSHFTGKWEKGATLRFLAADEDGNLGGMLSRIKDLVPNEFICIEHIGIVEFGREITSGPDVDDWKGAEETYTLKEADGKTLLTIDMDTIEENKSYFKEVWPAALRKLKTLCEK